jgi:hypothetical protein
MEKMELDLLEKGGKFKRKQGKVFLITIIVKERKIVLRADLTDWK